MFSRVGSISNIKFMDIPLSLYLKNNKNKKKKYLIDSEDNFNVRKQNHRIFLEGLDNIPGL
jgi:hypothetical protein